jgi:hypothetical protein
LPEIAPGPEAAGNRRIEMAAGYVPDGKCHCEHGQAKGKGYSQKTNPHAGKGRRQHRTAAPPENQPEGSKNSAMYFFIFLLLSFVESASQRLET